MLGYDAIDNMLFQGSASAGGIANLNPNPNPNPNPDPNLDPNPRQAASSQLSIGPTT